MLTLRDVSLEFFSLNLFHAEKASLLRVKDAAPSEAPSAAHETMNLEFVDVDVTFAIGAILFLSFHNTIIFIIQLNLMNIATEDRCLQEFNDLKFRHKQYQYIVYKIENETIVLVV